MTSERIEAAEALSARVTELTAKALRDAHRYESLVRRTRDASEEMHRAELERLVGVAMAVLAEEAKG
ncbi:MAG: hypothetical protein A2083_02190 [Gemmatimonadetes bacterium GWC2_71_9]|nr:MAG: hypothetical protein A2083_02190 [Gemmatimonadetes bacterium GWC2_71_9]